MDGYNYIDYQFEFDPVRLVSLGFSQDEVNCLGSLVNMGYKINNQTLQMYGLNYEQQQRIKYMYSICCGKVSIDTKEELIKHLKKMNNHAYKVGIGSLPISKITQIPRVAVVAGIKQEPYNIWNSNQYKGKDMLYIVQNVTGQKVTVETNRKPVLKHGADMSIPGVLDIKGTRVNGKAIVEFNKNYCRLCNRFIIVATLRRPEFHHGLYEVICYEGTKIYIYARTMGVKDGVKYNGSTERVYAFGFFEGEINQKLEAVAKYIYNGLHGVKAEYESGNQDYKLLDLVRQDAEVNDEESLMN